MIRYRFRHDDLLRTRFAISPLFEATSSVAVLRDPSRFSLHIPWVRAARPAVQGLDFSMLDAIVPHYGYTPDFISPPPESPLPDVAEELERVRRTPPKQVRRELAFRFEGVEPPPAVRRLVEHPRRGIHELADQIAGYWERAIAPHWDRIRDALEDDIAHRARLLTAAGPIEVFADLHPDVRWAGESLEVDRPYDADVELTGGGLQLVPSVFTWPGVAAMFDPPWQPALLYPPRGIGLLWEPAQRDDAALGALLGPGRARILGALEREASTTELARRLEASPAGVSEHLGVLRKAGLVRGRRAGRHVLYARTAAGDALLRAPSSGRGSPS